MQISRLLYGHEISILLLKGEPSINFIKQVLSMFFICFDYESLVIAK
jgi:hypothetical protein